MPLILALVADFDLRAFVVFRLIRYFKLARYSPGMTSLMEAVAPSGARSPPAS